MYEAFIATIFVAVIGGGIYAGYLYSKNQLPSLRQKLGNNSAESSTKKKGVNPNLTWVAGIFALIFILFGLGPLLSFLKLHDWSTNPLGALMESRIGIGTSILLPFSAVLLVYFMATNEKSRKALGQLGVWTFAITFMWISGNYAWNIALGNNPGAACNVTDWFDGNNSGVLPEGGIEITIGPGQWFYVPTNGNNYLAVEFTDETKREFGPWIKDRPAADFVLLGRDAAPNGGTRDHSAVKGNEVTMSEILRRKSGTRCMSFLLTYAEQAPN